MSEKKIKAKIGSNLDDTEVSGFYGDFKLSLSHGIGMAVHTIEFS